jgi:GT2 family glycosyltransferase
MPEISVVISTLNGAEGLDVCLRSLARQTVRDGMEVIVVDDGSTDNSAEVARAHGALVIQHERNAGLSAARNTGVLAATAPIVAFTDDDCEVEPDWAEHLISAHCTGVLGVGGHVIAEGAGFVGRYLKRHNPVAAREIEVAHSDAPLYRLRLYFIHLWTEQKREGRRPMHSLCGANMSFPRDALLEAGLFDPGFTRAADDLELCRRLNHVYPGGGFLLEPKARAVHHFTPSLRDTIRRARSYGQADARMLRKWPSTPFAFFPYPVVLIGLLLASLCRPARLPLALASPLAMFPAGIRDAIRTRTAEGLVDPFIQLAQEGAWDVGFLEGVWRDRQVQPERSQESGTCPTASNWTARGSS